MDGNTIDGMAVPVRMLNRMLPDVWQEERMDVEQEMGGGAGASWRRTQLVESSSNTADDGPG